MRNEDKIRSEIDKTFDLLDQKDLLPPNPYFYTRVKQRIEEKLKRKSNLSNYLKPVFFMFLLILNLTTVIWYNSSNISTNYTESNLELVDILKSDLNFENEQTDNLFFE